MKRNRFVHRFLRRYHTNVIPSSASVLEIGCSEGSLLHALKPKTGLGIDLSNEKIEKARCQYPYLSFHCGNAENSLLEDVLDIVEKRKAAGEYVEEHPLLDKYDE